MVVVELALGRTPIKGWLAGSANQVGLPPVKVRLRGFARVKGRRVSVDIQLPHAAVRGAPPPVRPSRPAAAGTSTDTDEAVAEALDNLREEAERELREIRLWIWMLAEIDWALLERLWLRRDEEDGDGDEDSALS